MRLTVQRCRSTSRSHPCEAASLINSNSRSLRDRSCGAYSLVVTNFAQLRYRSHSQAPSCGKRRQWPSSSSVLKKFVLSHSTDSSGKVPARNCSASGPASPWPKYSVVVLCHCLVTDMGVNERHLGAGMAQHLHDRMQPRTSFSQFCADRVAKAVGGYHRLTLVIDEPGLTACSFQRRLEQV